MNMNNFTNYLDSNLSYIKHSQDYIQFFIIVPSDVLCSMYLNAVSVLS